jgi:hypothetical protein
VEVNLEPAAGGGVIGLYGPAGVVLPRLVEAVGERGV